MTKNDLKQLMSIEEGASDLTIDKCRILNYKISVWGFTSTNSETKKKDILTLDFKEDIGYSIKNSYLIESREPAGILREIKKCTEEYYNGCIEYLNGNKCLASNWE